MSAVAPGAAFVGRGRELGALAALLAGQGRAAGGVLLISGPAGVGKTRLVDEAVRRATGLGVVRGYCPAETAPPLWPWRAALKRSGVEIARAPDIEPAAAKSAWFAVLGRMSDALIASAPLAVVLEDLHWADAASLDLLAHVGTAASGTGLTIIGTVRSPAVQDVAVRLGDLGRYGAVTLALAPFTVDEVAQLVDPTAAADVHKRTGGLPLLVAAVRAGYSSADLKRVTGTSVVVAAVEPGQKAPGSKSSRRNGSARVGTGSSSRSKIVRWTVHRSGCGKASAGLDIREVGRDDGQIHELVVTNPDYPTWGRVVIDCEGLMEWEYWGHIADDAGDADLAAVIIAIMATRPGDHTERYGRTASTPSPGELDRPHP